MRPAHSYYSIYNRRSLIRIIRRLHRERCDLSWSGMRDTCPDILSACQYHFVSWRRAVYAAGINYKRVKRIRNWEWNQDRVRRALQRYRRAGEAMNHNDFARRHWNLLNVAVYHFGTWREALASIGVDHRKVRKQRQWNEGAVLAKIRLLRREGKDLSIRAMQQMGRFSVVSAAQYHLGGWRKAIERAGLDYSRIRKRRQWSREVIIRIIRRIHRKGGDVSWSGMCRSGHRAVVRAYPWYFRNWGAAVTAAGLDYRKIRKPAEAKRVTRRSAS